ncbi:MAG: hypothetical protein GXP29_01295, partial [Planctomycetes bacterium]|nr:hypothetical protein [Planctomycetota bacterium]
GAILIGAFLVVVGVAGSRRRAVWNPVPQDITCAQLADNGFGTNSHVRLTDFYLCDFAYVYEENLTVWRKAWVPAVPRGGTVNLAAEAVPPSERGQTDLLPGRDIRVIVLLPKARSHKDIELEAKKEVLQGTIGSAARMFNSETKELMEENYPGLDYNNCYLLTVGVNATSEKQNAITTAVGVLLVAIGFFLTMREWRKSRENEWQTVKR